MIRALVILVVVPVAMLVGWLALDVPHPRAAFVYATQEPASLDPHRVSWLNELQLTNAMFEGLTRLNADTFLPEPGVAMRWDLSEDHRTYTFHLRPEARWSTGEPVVAEDFRFAWLRALDPQVGSFYESLFFVIDGAEALYRARVTLGAAAPTDGVGIDVLDAHTLRVRLARPCSYFLDLLAFPTFAPLHRPTIEKFAYRDGRVLPTTDQLWTRPGNIVVNGAFRLVQWEFKRGIRLERNPHYWERDSIAVDSLEAYITGDTNAALIAYETGRVDFVSPIERPVAQRLRAEVAAGRRDDYFEGDRFATFFYRVNCARPPFDNRDVRQALSLAIDRRAICEHVLRLGERPAFNYVPRSATPLMPRTLDDGRVVYYAPPEGLGAGLADDERVAAARAALERSGARSLLESRGVSITFPAETEQRLLAESIQQMWERDLGIRVELRPLEPKVIASRVRALDYDVARSNWFGDYMDPATFLEMYVSGSGQNRTGWAHPPYDELIFAAQFESDDERRFALLADAERILVEHELPIIPVFFRRGTLLLDPSFDGLRDNVRDQFQVHRVRPAAGARPAH